MSPWAARISTCFGVGRTPLAPGTAASAIALPFGWYLAGMGWYALTAAAVVATVLGVWASGTYAREMGIYDPSECVIDEVAGQWFTLIPLALENRSGWWPYFIAFLLFRLFDIWKPWPVSAAERWPGGFGIMMDDVVGGILAACVLYAALAFGWV